MNLEIRDLIRITHKDRTKELKIDWEKEAEKMDKSFFPPRTN